MGYGESNGGHVTDDVTWPWQVKVMIPTYLGPIISTTAGDTCRLGCNWAPTDESEGPQPTKVTGAHGWFRYATGIRAPNILAHCVVARYGSERWLDNPPGHNPLGQTPSVCEVVNRDIFNKIFFFSLLPAILHLYLSCCTISIKLTVVAEFFSYSGRRSYFDTGLKFNQPRLQILRGRRLCHFVDVFSCINCRSSSYYFEWKI